MASPLRYPVLVEAAAIPVERFGDLVLVAGGDDQVWPAAQMAREIQARHERHGLPTAVVTDPEAGHRTILPGEEPVNGGVAMRRGGTEQADRRLGAAVVSPAQSEEDDAAAGVLEEEAVEDRLSVL